MRRKERRNSWVVMRFGYMGVAKRMLSRCMNAQWVDSITVIPPSRYLTAFAYAEPNECRMATSHPSIYAAWRGQCLSRLADPVFTPLGEASVYPAWRAQCLRRLARSVFTPLGGPSVYPAWRGQCLRRLADPVIYAAWRTQYLRRLAGPVFIPLGEASVYPAWRGQCLSRLAGPDELVVPCVVATRMSTVACTLKMQAAGDEGAV